MTLRMRYISILNVSHIKIIFFINPYHWKKPIVYKYIQLVNANNLRELCDLSKFIFRAQNIISDML